MYSAVYFSGEQVEELRRGYLAISAKCDDMLLRYVGRHYRDGRAKEYATHGWCRRLKTMKRCIDNVYHILPPDRVDLPTDDDRYDVEINIQAFVFNVFGGIDDSLGYWFRRRVSERATGQNFQ